MSTSMMSGMPHMSSGSHMMSGSHPNLVFIQGGTGNIGSAAVHAMCKEFPMIHLRVGGRNKAKAEEKLKGCKAEFVEFDTDRKETLDPALKGVDTMFIVPSNNEKRRDEVIAMIDAAKRNGVKNILLLSVHSTKVNPHNMFAKQFMPMEEHLKKSGLNHTIIRLPFFADNYWGTVNTIKSQNAFYFPVGGDKRFHYIWTQDAGMAAAHILSNPSKHMNAEYTLMSDKLTTNNQIAQVFSKVLGRPIAFHQATRAQAMDAMKGMGMPEWQASGVVELWEDVNNDKWTEISHDYHKITGKTPTSMEMIIESQIAHACK